MKMLKKNDLPLNLTEKCHIGIFESAYCLFYKVIPLLHVNYQFWTEDIVVIGDYINYSEDEKGYSLLIDVPTYQDGKLIKVDHVYYGLFDRIADFDNWLTDPWFLY